MSSPLFLIACVAGIIVTPIAISKDVMNMETELRDALFKKQSYNPGIRPVRDVNKPVLITIDVTLHQIVDLNEKLQYLQSQLWFRIYWSDEFLKWNKEDYNGLYHIQVHHTEVWTPDIEIYNEMGLESRDERRNFPVTINHTGHVNWRFPRTLQTGCRIDMQYFPFDRQNCEMDIGSWTLDSRFANVTAHKSHGDISEYKTNGEWKVVAIPSKNHFHPYEAWAYGYQVVTFSIQLERRTNYYIFHMIFPCILISIVNLCSFLLPVSSGERISMSVTTLLGLVVFLLLVAELMPPQADVLPIMDLYFGMCIGIVSLSVVLNVFIIHLHFRGASGAKIPRRMRKIIYRLGKVLFYGTLMRDVGFQACEENEGLKDSGGNISTCNDVAMSTKENVTLVNFHKTSTGETAKIKSRRPSEIFGCEEAYMTLTERDRFNLPSHQKHASRSPSVFALDPILQKELQTPLARRATVHESRSTEWKVAAIILDRFFFLLFSLLMFTLIMYVLPPRNSSH